MNADVMTIAFYGIREYAHRSFRGAWPRRAALTLGLFFGSFTVIYGSPGVLGDLFPPFLSWGYTLGLLVTFLGIGLLVNVIIFYIIALVMAERRQNQRDRETLV